MKKVKIRYYDETEGHNSEYETYAETREEAVRKFKKVFDYKILAIFSKQPYSKAV